MAFILILSPNKAPPVLRLEGSTETMAMVLFGKSNKNRLTNSSTNEDFPAPPVPVIPKTGILTFSALALTSSNTFLLCSGKFSAALIKRAIAGTNFSSSLFISPFSLSPTW